MSTIELTLGVDDLPDYNEMGAKPSESTYDMIVLAEVDVHSRTIYTVTVFDTAHFMDIYFKVLTDKDQAVINSRILDFITNNIDFLMDGLKEQKLENDVDHYRDGRS